MINGAVYDPCDNQNRNLYGWFDRSGPRSVCPRTTSSARPALGIRWRRRFSPSAYPIGTTANALTNNYPNLQPNNKYQYLTSIKIDHIDRSVAGTSRGTTLPSNPTKTMRLTASTARQPRPAGTRPRLRRCISMRTTRPRQGLCSMPDSTYTRHNAAQNSAVQNFKASTLGLNTAANMPGGAANTFPIIHGLQTNRQSVPQLGINNAPFIDDNW